MSDSTDHFIYIYIKWLLQCAFIDPGICLRACYFLQTTPMPRDLELTFLEAKPETGIPVKVFTKIILLGKGMNGIFQIHSLALPHSPPHTQTHTHTKLCLQTIFLGKRSLHHSRSYIHLWFYEIWSTGQDHITNTLIPTLKG